MEYIMAFTGSELRMRILLSLMDGNKNTSDLAEEISARHTTILHAIKHLSKLGIITKNEDVYALTNLGKMQAYILENLLSYFTILEGQRDFWLSHDVSGIPVDLLNRLGMLSDSEVMVPDPVMPLENHEKLISMIAKSEDIKAVLPVLITPEQCNVLADPIKEGLNVNLIVTYRLLETISRKCKTLECMYKELIGYNNFNLYWTPEDVKVALVVTESFLYLGLYNFDGIYDIGSGLIYVGDGAVAWGTKLFEYYRKKSNLIVDTSQAVELLQKHGLPLGDHSDTTKIRSNS